MFHAAWDAAIHTGLLYNSISHPDRTLGWCSYNSSVLIDWSSFCCHFWLSTVKIKWRSGKSDGVDSFDRLGNLTQIGFKSLIFQPVWPWHLMDDLEKQRGTCSVLRQAMCDISKPWVNSSWSYSPETLNSGQRMSSHMYQKYTHDLMCSVP